MAVTSSLSGRRLLHAAVLVGLVTGVMLLTPGLSEAFSSTVTLRREYRQGTTKFVEMAGTYRLAGGERISTVRVVMLDSNRRLASSAMGTVDRRQHTWRGAVGDFRGAYYYAEFYITNPQGQNLRVFTTAVYRWTGQ